jgi:transposase, IS5 family
VATTIHSPVESPLLADGARVLTRTIQRATACLDTTATRGRTLVRNRRGTVRRLTKQLIDATRRRGEQAATQVQDGYRQVLRVTQPVVEQAQQLQQQLQLQHDRTARRLRDTLETVVPRVEQVIRQTPRRVLHGEAVPAGENRVSVVEPQTAILRNGKAGRPTEFGRVVGLAETEGGIRTQARVLEGTPDAAVEGVPSLDHHLAHFKRPPQLLAGDGKLATATTERTAQQRGVRHVVLPRPGRKSAAGWPMNGSGGSGGGGTGAQGWKGASVGSTAGKGWSGAAITGRRGWSAGWAGASLPMICARSHAIARPRPRRSGPVPIRMGVKNG